ncbi:ribonucleotide reductase inhibitor [Purpureocillium lavendulum]|uniref:Ribonucleotide reductase inhibitor n=1 Tax=Purpureocillium lavendulum TaxID=1247861 RepID=A0AB34G893_9HYPO|nr:ribonucleotide reductase inhibitor [Purpureocillium lavendulum]
MDNPSRKNVAIVGAGIFGLSLALSLRKRGHDVTVFDQHRYDETSYHPSEAEPELVASVDHNKIFRASYGTKLHYQRLALESRKAWIRINKELQETSPGAEDLFVSCGMLRVQPTASLSALEQETLTNMTRDGLRDTQFVEGDSDDRERASERGWAAKLLDFAIPNDPDKRSFEAVLDSLAGFTRCYSGCAYFYHLAEQTGVAFKLGPEQGKFDCLVEEQAGSDKKAVGLKTKDGRVHKSDVVVIAAGSFSTQLLPDLSYHLESSAGSVATFKIEKGDTTLWDKYSPEKFPVITWKSTPRGKDGKDTGSVYVLPRTPEGLVKIGYRGVKFTNFQPAPEGTPFTQDSKWEFVSIFLPEFQDVPFYSTKLCWYTDSLDNSFLASPTIDYVPTYIGNSLFVCTGGSGHGAKFMPVLGEHAADIFENGDGSTTPMRPFWRWREDMPRRNGLQEGPDGPRNIGEKAAQG